MWFDQGTRLDYGLRPVVINHIGIYALSITCGQLGNNTQALFLLCQSVHTLSTAVVESHFVPAWCSISLCLMPVQC